jgi:hypothetical protein
MKISNKMGRQTAGTRCFQTVAHGKDAGPEDYYYKEFSS